MESRRRARRTFAAFLGVVVVLASIELFALWKSNQREAIPLSPVAQSVTSTPPQPVSAPAAAPAAKEIVGWVDEPPAASVVGDRFYTSGWALAHDEIARVEIVIDGKAYPARYGQPRPDVARARPGFPNGSASGFEFEASLTDLPPVRHGVEYVATDKSGKSKTFARRGVIPPAAMAMWRPLLDVSPRLADRKFYFLMMMSSITAGAGEEVDTRYRGYESRTMRIGISVPILYMRTTLGKAGDWQFDPAFDITRKCRDRLVAEDNLQTVIKLAIDKHVPVQFILNGGIWGDASCSTPEWDLTDHLEEDPANCQWTQSNQVFPDDYLKGLAGSYDSPELARSLTYHVYAKNIRDYKKRNLQAAARVVARFAREHPDLFVGVALDSDTYMNPFFLQREIFDYNPGMVRQFRDWLRGAGVYANAGGPGTPDLRRYRRAHPLALEDVNRIARRDWKSWNEVDPPRHLPGSPRDPLQPGETPFWDDPWWHLWDAFRKHIVGLHYDELSAWVRELGIPRDKIFSAQGFIRPDPGLRPPALRIESHTQNYDSAGVSIQGSIPRFGHLGAVIYGEAARNEVPMEWPHSMFATFGRLDDGWAIVEYNSTDLKKPTTPPTYGVAYKTFRDAFNYGASEISAMAWNGGDGVNVGQAGYVPYTTWKNTAPEEAMLDFLVSHADIPRGARLWTFGTPRHVDDDGWSAALGDIESGAGFLTLRPDARRVTLLSPEDQLIRPRAIERMIMRWSGPHRPLRVRVAAQVDPDTAWIDVGSSRGGQVEFAWPAAWRTRDVVVERLKVEVEFADDASAAVLSRVLLYPRAN